jgi:hypothetical protein
MSKSRQATLLLDGNVLDSTCLPLRLFRLVHLYWTFPGRVRRSGEGPAVGAPEMGFAASMSDGLAEVAGGGILL